MFANHTIGVVVPAYNEAADIGRVIKTVPAYVDRIYAVDDGSTDHTRQEIEHHAHSRNRLTTSDRAAYDEVVVSLHHDRNRGVGAAIKTGYRAALADGLDVVAVMGGDAQMNPDALHRYLRPITDGTVDYTKGNRFMQPEDLWAMPRFRLVGNVTLSLLTKVASGYWQLADSQNGYTAISGTALERIDLDDLYEYYGYCNDLLIRLNVAGARVADVGASSRDVYEGQWKSHIRYVEYVPRVSWMLLRRFVWRLWRKHLRGDRHPLALGYLLGLALFITGIVGMVAGLIGVGPGSMTVASLGAVGVGAVSFVVGGFLDRNHNRPLSYAIAPDVSAVQADPARPMG